MRHRQRQRDTFKQEISWASPERREAPHEEKNFFFSWRKEILHATSWDVSGPRIEMLYASFCKLGFIENFPQTILFPRRRVSMPIRVCCEDVQRELWTLSCFSNALFLNLLTWVDPVSSGPLVYILLSLMFYYCYSDLSDLSCIFKGIQTSCFLIVWGLVTE